MKRLIYLLIPLFSLVVAVCISRAGFVSAAPLGGTLTVNTSNDSQTVDDSELSLREALSVTNGTLTGPFSLAERTQMSGCTFDVSGFITSGCGFGNDTIQFSGTLTQVLLTSRPPFIGATGTTVDGQVNSGVILINGQGLADLGFNVGANNVTIKNLAVFNLVSSSSAVALANGSWKGLRVANSYLGVPPNATGCNDSRIVSKVNFPIFILGGSGTGASGDGTAYIYNNVIGCAVYDGIADNNAPYTYIGQDSTGASNPNWIGVTPSGSAIGNGAYGVSFCCTTGTQGNQVISNTIANNAKEGILLQSVSQNTISGNLVHDNGASGIVLISSDHQTLNNNVVHDNQGAGIWMTGTQTIDNAISGGASFHNGATGITEGGGADLNWWNALSAYDNLGLGIDKFDDGLPDATGGIVFESSVRAGNAVTITGNYPGVVYLFYIYQVELYRVAWDPSGYGEGKTYVGTTSFEWNLAGDYHWSITDATAGTKCYPYTAVMTLIDPIGGTRTSYEFTQNLPCSLYVPVIVKP